MSATFTASGSRIRTIARSTTAVVNELAGALLRIANNSGVANGPLSKRLDFYMNGLRIWVTAKQLEAVTMELLGTNDRLIDRWDLPLDYQESDEEEGLYATNTDQLEAYLAKHPPRDVVRYRIIVSFNTESPIAVPGWKSCKFSDASHLQRREVTSKLVSSRYVRAAAFVFTDPSSQSEE